MKCVRLIFVAVFLICSTAYAIGHEIGECAWPGCEGGNGGGGGFNTVRFIWEFPEVERVETVHHFLGTGSGDTLTDVFCECQDGTSIVFEIYNDAASVSDTPFTCTSDQDNEWDSTDLNSAAVFAAGSDYDLDITAVNGSPSGCSVFGYF